jgi:hypothetical protein
MEELGIVCQQSFPYDTTYLGRSDFNLSAIHRIGLDIFLQEQ